MLLKHIHPDQLPVHYGGNATGPDDDVTCGVRAEAPHCFLCNFYMMIF